jgi:hypothetical protein
MLPWNASHARKATDFAGNEMSASSTRGAQGSKLPVVAGRRDQDFPINSVYNPPNEGPFAYPSMRADDYRHMDWSGRRELAKNLLEVDLVGS